MKKSAAGWCVSALVFLNSAGLDARADLPTNFPPIAVTTHVTNQVAEGYIFLASQSSGSGSYLMILNNDGTPVDGDKYKELAVAAGDFKLQSNGQLSYAQTLAPLSYTGGWDVEHKLVDETLTNVLETIQMRNGYLAEFHDFQLLPNGNALVLGYYLSDVDLSQIVTNGNPAAQISGCVIQELDAQRNAVFQWRSWDHYNFADHTYPNPAAAKISDFHVNNLNLDTDGHLIAGTPAEIRKINRQTGAVMWTLGGPENEFTVTGPGASVSHFGGHGTYRLPNGNFLMYNNSDGVGTSRVFEYALDEVNKIATNVWSYTPDTVIRGRFTGNAQRLPNGNTFICWGIPRNAGVPVCTEVTPAGVKVFELSFTNTSIQSYRAFRFPYPVAGQAIEFMRIELAAGNTYDFTNTGVAVEVISGAGGYNDVTVKREPYAPVTPLFQTKAPQVLPVRVSLTEFAISSMDVRVEFDALSFGFSNPTNLTVYHRPQAGQGLFLPQPTDYNPVTKKLRATLTLTAQSGEFGEFIFGYPDLADVAYPPMLAEVESYRVQTNEIVAPKLAATGMVYTVNQELPVLLSWSPRGFARWFQLQIATTPDFTSPVVTVPYQTDAFLVWSNAAPNTIYHYRVKTWNEGGESAWSVGTFQTTAPTITVTTPNGGEAWQRGLSSYIRWNDNLAENVIIDLYKNGVFVNSLATNGSSGAYRWTVGLNLVPGSDYSIKIRSAANGALFDVSDSAFNIDVPRITGLQKNLANAWVLQWTGSAAGVYVEFNPTLASNLWQTVGGPVTGSSWTNSLPAGLEGFYRLRLP